MSDPTCSCCGTDANRDDERTDGGASEIDGGPASADSGTTTTDDAPTNVLDRRVPAAVGELLATAYGMESKPRTLGDLIDGLQSWARGHDVWPPSFEDLCHVEDSGHVLEFDGEIHTFACVVDPLMVPEILDREELLVRSASPVEGAEVEIRIEGDEVAVTPSTAVLSLGAAHSVARMDGDEFAPEEAYGQLCAYGNAFPNRTTYEAWDSEISEAATMAIPMVEGVELARALVDGG